MKNFDDGEVSEIYLNALAHVYDPHSDYFGPEEAQNFSIAMNLSLVGIGATLEAGDSGCKIRELVPGGPAERVASSSPATALCLSRRMERSPSISRICRSHVRSSSFEGQRARPSNSPSSPPIQAWKRPAKPYGSYGTRLNSNSSRPRRRSSISRAPIGKRPARRYRPALLFMKGQTVRTAAPRPMSHA